MAADNIASYNYMSALLMLLYIFCFISGAATTTLLVIWGKLNHNHSQFALPLVLEALLLIIFGFGNVHNPIYIIMLLCFLMGLQNAVITKITNTSIRTTHITGMSTDIGIEIGRLLFPIISKKNPPLEFNNERIMLHLSIISLFFLGGIIGAFGFNFFSYSFVVPLALYLLFLSIQPIWQDLVISKYVRLRSHRHSK